jgi:hypothetical protein
MQATSKVLMIRPAAFAFNEQTAVNNFYQSNQGEKDPQAIALQAQAEFDLLAKSLTKAGVSVFILDDTAEPHTPDSLFPNNWVSMHHTGTVALYPMFAPNRRLERRPDLIPFLASQDFTIDKVQLYTHFEQSEQYLEGTGSLVLDHVHRIAYAALSPRTHRELVEKWCSDFGYEPFIFEAHQQTPWGTKEVYHTNVVLSIGSDFALVGTENISNGSELLLEKLKATGKHIVALTDAQITDFAANALELVSSHGQRVLVLSERAWLSLDQSDRKWFSMNMTVVHTPLHTIEEHGGGSARCMIAEIFLPTKI